MGKPDSIFDQVDEGVRARAIAEAEADRAAGRVHDHETVGRWLQACEAALQAGHPLPPPPAAERR